MKIENLASAIAAMASALALSGCGEAAPGNADIRAAMEKQLMLIGGKEGVESQKDALDKIKVNKCVPADLGGFKCEFSAGSGPQIGRFKKGDNGWEFVGVAGG